MTTICVMQPYLFPYLPYYQLARAVDAFWVLDDVQFIRRGFMNRNTILLNGVRHALTFPVSTGQRSDLIRDKALPADFGLYLNKVKQTLFHAYGTAPYGAEVFALAGALTGASFLDIAMQALRVSFDRLGLNTPLHLTSSLGLSQSIGAQDRILSICDHVRATRYFNPIGGRDLYDAGAFAAKGIELRFLDGACAPYAQVGTGSFQANLSILDLIAHVDPADYPVHLDSFKLC